MAIRHFVAYGNSDQASFRSEEVQGAFDFLTVPGTIATYYAEATAAFVLSSGLDYVIDPRTPLFQEYVAEPRASHYSLAASLSGELHDRLSGGATNLGVHDFTRQVLEEMVSSFVEFQQTYSEQASQIQERIGRYQALLAEARGVPAERLSSSRGDYRPPSFILLPYFACRRVGDDWWELNAEVWRLAAERADSPELSPVVVVSYVEDLPKAIDAIPTGLASTVMIWLTNFDERTARFDALERLWEFFARGDTSAYYVVNMYGGYFSVCLGRVGLWGFNNGLGYSESRGWPELAATGAAPARYYIPSLHMFMSTRAAQSLIDMEPELACTCRVCSGPEARIDSLHYHDLKTHFALARKWEIEFASGHGGDDVAGQMVEGAEMAERAGELLPIRLRPDVDFLYRWADVVRDAG